MAMGNRFGLMSRDMKEIGPMIKQMGLVNCIMLMAISMKASGKTTKLMEEALILMQMEQGILENGKMINNMGMALRHGLTEQSMKVNTSKEKRMAEVN
jgi:hypothetical protein